MWFLILGVVTILCAYYYLISIFNYWKKKGVPHPEVSKVWGNVKEAVTFKKNLGQAYHDAYEQFPGYRYVGYYRFRTPIIILRDPEVIKDAMVKNFTSFHDNDIDVDEKLDPFMARNPFFTKGERWRTLRNQLTPSFTSKQIKSMVPLMAVVGSTMVKQLKEAGSTGVNGKEFCEKYTLDVVASCAFGLETNCFLDPNSEFKKMGKKVINQSFFTAIRIFIQFLVPQLANFLRIQFVPEEAANYFRKLISNTMDYRRANNVVRHDFLDLQLELKRKLGENVFDNEDITAHAVGFIIDGFETSSILLSFALYELAANPDIQENLWREVDEVLEKHNQITYEALQDMTYLEKFLCEILRLHPPAMFLTRRCTKPFTLPPPVGDGSGVPIDPETPILISVYSLHHDPAYFPDPERCDPERFSEEGKESRPKFTYMPFGEGPRMCLGQRFGVTQVKVALACLVQNFQIRVNKKMITPVEIDPGYFLMGAKGGIWLDFCRRQK